MVIDGGGLFYATVFTGFTRLFLELHSGKGKVFLALEWVVAARATWGDVYIRLKLLLSSEGVVELGFGVVGYQDVAFVVDAKANGGDWKLIVLTGIILGE